MKTGVPEIPKLPEQNQEEIEPDKNILDLIAKKVAQVGMAAPAIFFIEMNRPLSFIGSQMMVFFEPFLMAFVNTTKYRQFALLMEDRKNIDVLVDMIDKYDYEYKAKEKEEKLKARALQKAGRKKRRRKEK